MQQNSKNPTGQGGAMNQEKFISQSQPDYSTTDRECKINNLEYFTVPRDFSNLPIGATDIDGMIEYHNRAFILFETKYEDSELPTGQRLALERLCDATTAAGKKSIVFVTTHGNDKIIDMARGSVTAYRYNYQWHEPKCEKTLGEAVQWFIDKVDGVK